MNSSSYTFNRGRFCHLKSRIPRHQPLLLPGRLSRNFSFRKNALRFRGFTPFYPDFYFVLFLYLI